MSLYRKYRPQTFEDVVGQEHVARTLRHALAASPPRVAHAYLFTGPRGIGKTTNARLLAKCLNCEQGPTPTPCNECDFCRGVASNQPMMDLLEIDAASHTGVDNIREVIIDKIAIAPSQGRYRVTIIDEVHMLSASAFNALLKTLEEPPPHCVFVLATTETHKVPATILSRCQRFDFRRVTPTDIAERLHYVARCENLELHPEAARLLARHADGALRDALTLLEQVSAFAPESIGPQDVAMVLGSVPRELIHDLIEAVAARDARALLEGCEAAVEVGASLHQLARDLSATARDLLLHSVGYARAALASPDEEEWLATQASLLGRGALESLLALLRDAEKEMRSSSDHRLLLELTLLKAATPGFASSTAAPTAHHGATDFGASNGNGAHSTPRATSIRAEAAPAPATVETPKAVAVETPKTVMDEAPVAADDIAARADTTNQGRVDQETAGESEAAALADQGMRAEDLAAGEAPSQKVEADPVAASRANDGRRGRRITSYEELVELWPKLLMRIRKKIGVTAVAYLHDARPAAFTDDEIVLEFTKEFHHAKALDASKRLPFEEKICEVLDRPRRVRFVLAPPPAPAPVPTSQEPESTSSDDDDDLEGEDDIVSYAQTIFAAEILGRSGDR